MFLVSDPKLLHGSVTYRFLVFYPSRRGQGSDMGEAKKIALKMAHETGLTYINGYDHPHIMAGQGTIGLEIVEQVSNIDAVVVPVGGGGLIAGVATAIKNLSPQTKIIVSRYLCSFSFHVK